MQIRTLLNDAIAKLRAEKIESPRLEAEILMMYVTGYKRVELITHDTEELNVLNETLFRTLVEQRLKGHPIAHLTGEKDFWDMTLKVTSDTLIPRPDTEILVEKALTLIDCNDFHRVLDLGTGSGAIILALKHERKDLEAVAVDLSQAALEVARENSIKYNLDVDFREGSWFAPVGAERFDLIVSNPPYIEENDHHLQEGDVRFEPKSALVSGVDGLEDIRAILSEAYLHLVQGGYLMFEHGYNQGAAVRELFMQHGFCKVETIRDYGQNERVTLGCLE